MNISYDDIRVAARYFEHHVKFLEGSFPDKRLSSLKRIYPQDQKVIDRFYQLWNELQDLHVKFICDMEGKDDTLKCQIELFKEHEDYDKCQELYYDWHWKLTEFLERLDSSAGIKISLKSENVQPSTSKDKDQDLCSKNFDESELRCFFNSEEYYTNTLKEFELEEPKIMKRNDYIDWWDYFMSVAYIASLRSKDPNTQVGACIVNRENRIISIGYNGMPNYCSDDVLPWNRTSSNPMNVKYLYVCHAEMNAIMNKTSYDCKDCSLFVLLFPCNECAKMIIQAGICRVVYLSDKYSNELKFKASRILLRMAGIELIEYIPKQRQIIIDFDRMISSIPK